MADRDPVPNDPGNNRFSKVSRTASFWVLLALLSILAMQMFRGQEEASSVISYTQFREQLEAANIDSVLVIQGIRIEGALRSPIMNNGEETVAFRTMLPGEIQESMLDRLEEQGTIILAEGETQGLGTILISILPWLLFIAFWIWIFRTMQGGGNKAFQFGRSKAKLISPDKPSVTFADVAGADEAKMELEEIIEFLKDPQKFSRLGGRLPKGVLLVGPPGTGKTLLARAVAGEAERPFFQMSGSDFVEMFVGVGASRVRDLFDQGKAHAPCIIFVDEIDAVGRHRGAGLGGGHDEREQTLNALLVEMDGFEANEGVILLAATNRPDVLDPALLRPGRFDRQVVVDLPDVKGREGILRVHAKKLPLDDDVTLGIIAKGTPGLSGADLETIGNEAALLAARDGADRVVMDHFERAKDKVMLGAERKSMVLTENDRKLTAYHEAGHVVMGLRIPGLDPVHKVTIVPRGRALGITASLPEEDRHTYTKEWLEGQLTMLFGGRVAEELDVEPIAEAIAVLLAKLNQPIAARGELGCVGSLRHQEDLRRRDFAVETRQQLLDFHEIGFVRDDNRRELDSAFDRTFWLSSGAFERIEYNSNYNIYWAANASTLRSWQINQGVEVDLRNRFSFEVGWQEQYILFEKGFRNRQFEIEVGYNTRAFESVRLGYAWGKNFDADFTLWSTEAAYKITEQLSAAYELQRLSLDPDPEDETTWIHVLRAEQFFTPDLFLKLFHYIYIYLQVEHRIQALAKYLQGITKNYGLLTD